ncbi:MAG: hypothetical protein D3923_11150, partial [Candidatus Electrothrix sp. AR3]|nr:hypothetical protein [Candidatus Electrothrix sp. AR3]
PSIIKKLGGDAFDDKCILGTEEGCWIDFPRIYLYKIPTLEELKLIGPTTWELTVEDGTNSSFDKDSVKWNIFHNTDRSKDDDASITPSSCSKSGSTTTCTGTTTLKPGSGSKDNYTVYASGNGFLGGFDLTQFASLYKVETPLPSSARTEITADNGQKWGAWQAKYECPQNTYARGFSLQVEGKQGDGDDTALNNVRLICSDGSTVQSAGSPGWGSWGSPVECASDSYFSGFSLKVESSQGGGDDTAANSMKGVCSKNGTQISTIEPSNAGPWGSFGDSKFCSGGQVCGAQLKIEASQGGGDDTAVNNVTLICCPF